MCATSCQVPSLSVACEATDTWACLVIPLTVEQFYGVFRAYNFEVRPTQLLLVLLGLAGVGLVLLPRQHSGIAVFAILGSHWAWIRFNGADAVRIRDVLYSASSGSPNVSSWVGNMAFRWVFTQKGENDKYARQVHSAAGIAVVVDRTADKPNWVEVGRCYERFELQATVLGIPNALLNQPVEVVAPRPPFASALELNGQRPDLVGRFGRGSDLPRSLGRPVEAVLI